MAAFNVKPPPSPAEEVRTSLRRSQPRTIAVLVAWLPKKGALLMPKAPAQDLHQLLDEVEAEVLASDPTL